MISVAIWYGAMSFISAPPRNECKKSSVVFLIIYLAKIGIYHPSPFISLVSISTLKALLVADRTYLQING